MREGSLDAPTRHPLAWNDPDFADTSKLDQEMRRVFDICHGCRRCFNLCDSFPRLFDLVDQSPEEVAGVKSEDFKGVVDACTLCDLCFMTKCPYVPPHEFNVDFPHLMLRYRYAERQHGKREGIAGELSEIDRNGKIGTVLAPLANWATARDNHLTRPAMEKIADVHRDAALPKFNGKTLVTQAKADPVAVNREAPGFGRKAVLYATCFANYHNPGIGLAARAVLAKNGVETEIVYPRCCGMPQLEQGDLPRVSETAKAVSAALLPWIDKGYDVIAPIPSCALMLKFEWPLLAPGDASVKKLSQSTFDISEYVVDIAKRNGLAPGLKALDGGVALHIACHARAQNMGQKAAEMLALIPGADLKVIERCSGHGGSWGVRKENFETALKIGRPVARQAKESGKPHIASECPLAAVHILQGIEKLGGEVPAEAPHPIELFARAYGV
jgi:glycerol-3-phosphate dehydrogenase subunit C